MDSQSVLRDSLNKTGLSSCSTQSSQSESIGLIVKKLGHDLAEIRSRSLDNLISKVENGLVGEEELAQNKEIFFKLFELFQYDDFSQHEQLLSLLLKLSKHKSTARAIMFVNGLQKLTAIKSQFKDAKLKADAQHMIDQLMDNLAELGAANISSSLSSKSNSFDASGSYCHSNDLDRVRKLQSNLLMTSQHSNSSGHSEKTLLCDDLGASVQLDSDKKSKNNNSKAEKVNFKL
jgi:hypothetical protein